MGKLQNVLRIASAIAVVINVGLLIFAFSYDLYDLQILAIVNMIFLSFALLYEKKG